MGSPDRRQTVLVDNNLRGTGTLIEMSVAKDKRAEDDAGTKRDRPYEIVHADHSTSHATLLFFQVVPANHAGDSPRIAANARAPARRRPPQLTIWSQFTIHKIVRCTKAMAYGYALHNRGTYPTILQPHSPDALTRLLSPNRG